MDGTKGAGTLPGTDRIGKGAGRGRLPAWFRTRLPTGERYRRLRRILDEERLPTICNSAICPNRGECWSRGIATFLILGDVCTRACAFCNVKTGRPAAADEGEPARVARAVRDLGLRHVVITSVDRDDLPDGGAGHYARVIDAVRAAAPGCAVEVLVPDFRGDLEAADRVIGAAPEVFGHNIETVPSLYRTARRGSDYGRSLGLLRHVAEAGAGMLVKTGLMVGLGETRDELRRTMAEIRGTGCGMLTVGQYLRPSPAHLDVVRFYDPEEFAEIRAEALSLGFTRVMAGPMVRSSYLADAQVAG
jgi:lipoic acid synthetase